MLLPRLASWCYRRRRLVVVAWIVLLVGVNVLEDADMDIAVHTAIEGMFYNQGEACTSTARLLVHRSRYDEFVARFVAATMRTST